MRTFAKSMGALLVLALILLILLGPSPWLRGVVFGPAALASLAPWREGIEYSAYLSEVLLILFFGGFIFVEAFARRVAVTLGGVADRNVEAFNRAIAEATDNSSRMTAYLAKFTAQGRLSGREWRACLATLFRLQKTAANPLHLVRGTLWILAHMPGRLYGALALVLVLAKTLSEMALILIEG